jgi:hypothetical protein
MVCDRWKDSFDNFLADMGCVPFEGAQVDRKDSDGNYEPGNCRWLSNAENSRNRKTNKLTMEIARKIRRQKKEGWTARELAAIWKVTIDMVNKILRGLCWAEQIDYAAQTPGMENPEGYY